MWKWLSSAWFYLSLHTHSWITLVLTSYVSYLHFLNHPSTTENDFILCPLQTTELITGKSSANMIRSEFTTLHAASYLAWLGGTVSQTPLTNSSLLCQNSTRAPPPCWEFISLRVSIDVCWWKFLLKYTEAELLKAVMSFISLLLIY